jgi:STE24 endopeptidase
MNIYQIIILATLLGKYFIDLISQWLNLKALRPELPEEFAGFYDAERYRKSQEYTRTRTRFHIIQSTCSLIVLLLFWFLGGFNTLDNIVRSWGLNRLLTGLCYIGLLALLSSILSIPFQLYSTFVIEERFGFNKTTLATFITDRLKGLALAVVLGGAVLAVILWLFDAAGPLAWLYCWIAVTVFSLLMQFIAPVWILPLFNKYTPLPDGELKSAIGEYAKSVHFGFRDIFVMDGSKRSSKANAFFTGFGKNKRIALFDTLIAEQSVPEIVAVLAHEVGHYKLKHIIVGTLITILHTGFLFFLLSFFIRSQGLVSAFYMEHVSVYAGVVFFGLLYEPVSFLLSIFLNMVSRHNEYSADRYSIRTTQQPEHLVTALKKLSVNNLATLTAHPLYVLLNYSHPPLLQRIKAIYHQSAQVG